VRLPGSEPFAYGAHPLLKNVDLLGVIALGQPGAAVLRVAANTFQTAEADRDI
jgi:hypothetical protein